MIDLKEQLLDLFKKEQMLAFFDFQLRLGGNEPLSGLCKISRPKGSGEQGQYISLLLLIDTPNETVWRQVDTFTNAIGWNAFRGEMPGVQTVLPIPNFHRGAGMYFKEADIYLDGDVVVSKGYVSTKLYPAILRVIGLKGGELVYWENVPERKQEFTDIAPEKESSQSLFGKLKEFFGL
jgi:hypothetical protein